MTSLESICVVPAMNPAVLVNAVSHRQLFAAKLPVIILIAAARAGLSVAVLKSSNHHVRFFCFSTACHFCRDGCCSPYTGEAWKPWMGLNEPSQEYLDAVNAAGSRSRRPIPTGPVEDNANPVVFALFVETDKVKALTINAANGSIISTVPCGFDNHGEMTRIFNWDQKREVFYYVEANFTAPPMPQGRQVTLWTIDPRTGKTSGRALGGVYNMPSYFWR